MAKYRIYSTDGKLIAEVYADEITTKGESIFLYKGECDVEVVAIVSHNHTIVKC